MPAGDEFGQTLELATAKGTLEIGDAIVVAEFLHLVIPRASLCERRLIASEGWLIWLR